MTTTVQELMSRQLVTLNGDAPISAAAKEMFEADIGAVLVEDDGRVSGIVTDRDIVIRAVAHGRDVDTTPVSAICSGDLTMVAPEEPLEAAIELMRTRAIRRVLVVDSQQRALGILSLGDLATARDSTSVLGQISGAPPNS
jgi:CBS domain-containing protein